VIRRLFIGFLALFLVGAREPVLVPDVSQRNVDIIYSFTGAELLLFGAILYPDGRFPQRDADIAVVLKGPSEPVLVREKRRLLGLIWANAESARFQSAPGFYAIATSRPLDRLIDERTAAIYELGLGNIQLSPADARARDMQQRFEDGLIALKRKNELYVDRTGEVEITSGVLYRARLPIPARVPVGHYTAETLLIRDGRILAAATRDIVIRKSGFERFVAQSAVTSPFTYGIAAILLSLALGWLASAVFRRFRRP
jgi:uncharacterized protein (TIGR02186 family)